MIFHFIFIPLTIFISILPIFITFAPCSLKTLLVEKYKNVDTVNQECQILFRNLAYREGQGIIQK